MNNGRAPVQGHSTSVAVVGSRARQRRLRRFSAGHVVWSGLLRVMQRVVHYKHGDHLEFKLNFSVRDLLSDKSRAVKDQLEALLQAVQRAGSYQARDEAARAMHAVMDALKERVPPDVLSRLADSLQLREAARLGRAAAQRLQRDGGKSAGEDKTAGKSDVSGETGKGGAQTL
jgi:uncharacterized protein (DUF2267 family)